MSRQSLLDTYFKSNKVNASPSLPVNSIKKNNVKKKVIAKRSLSLIKPTTPSKSPRLGNDKPQSEEIVDLCSDHGGTPSYCHPMAQCLRTPTKIENSISENRNVLARNIFASPSISSNHSVTSIVSKPATTSPFQHANNCDDSTGYDSDSQATISYSLPPTPQSPWSTPQTPSTSHKSPNSNPNKKYFSPVKKRAVPIKKSARRNLTQNLVDISDKNDLFNNACLGMDDKTIFLLTIINEYICSLPLNHLLDEKSQSLLSKSMRVDKPGMRLVCRLYWRKRGWYKLNKISTLLSNEPIDDPTLYRALYSLQEHGFLILGGSEGNAMNFDEFIDILSHDDVKQICKELKLKIKSKQNAITALKAYSKKKPIASFFSASTCDNSSRLLKIMSAKAGPCYKLSDLASKTLYNLYILMYLGIDYNLIRDKKLELTLVNNKIKREIYPVEEHMLDNASVVFKQRDEFERYVEAHNIYEMYIIETDTNIKNEMVTEVFEDYKNISNSETLRVKSLSIWLRRFTPLYIYIKIMDAGVQDLKKGKRFDFALEILEALIVQDTCRQHKKAEWFAEKALVLHKCGQAEKAAQALLDGFKSDLSEEDKDIMRTRAKIFARQKNIDLAENIRADLLEHADIDDIQENNFNGVHIYKQPMERINQKGKLKFETRDVDGRTVQDVEEYCLSRYIDTGEFTDGKHWEGNFVTSIFFLLFWDIIYWRPPNCAGVFLTRYQRFPLDLFCESFYINRRDSIEARLALIERCTTEDMLEIMRTTAQSRPEGEISGVGVPLAEALSAARALGARGAAALCRRLARNYRRAHSGFPDLTLWDTRTGKIRFVEVKSDADKPSLKQLRWLHYLRRCGLDAEFCYVGAHTTRSKARPVHTAGASTLH